MLSGQALTGPVPDNDPSTESAENGSKKWSRRRVLTVGLGGIATVAVVGVAGVELVAHGILPGKQLLNELDGACAVPNQELKFSPEGPSISHHFFSRARNRSVGFTIAYPPGHGIGSHLPLVVALHGFGASHLNALSGMSLQQALALHVDGQPLSPMAMVAADGGGGYWNPHPGDNPMAMVIDELIPMCQKLGLGQSPGTVGTLGISMGGYGALLFAEKYPRLIAAVAAISPAIWTNYAEARDANSGAYASAEDFSANDAVTHADALVGIPVRVASGNADPFHGGVEALARVLPVNAVVDFANGCHTGPFFTAQEPPSLSFLAKHLVTS